MAKRQQIDKTSAAQNSHNPTNRYDSKHVCIDAEKQPDPALVCSDLNHRGFMSYETIRRQLLYSSSTDRPWIVLDIDDGPLFWQLIFEEWCGFDLIPHREFEEAFERFRDDHPGQHIIRSEYDSGEWFDELSDTFEIHRGACATRIDGLSWTTNYGVAERFSRGYRIWESDQPTVLTATIAKGEVAFATNERGEFEIVPFSIPDVPKLPRKSA